MRHASSDPSASSCNSATPACLSSAAEPGGAAEVLGAAASIASLLPVVDRLREELREWRGVVVVLVEDDWLPA